MLLENLTKPVRWLLASQARFWAGEVLNVALENKPGIFNWVQVWRLRWPIDFIDVFFLEEVTASTGGMNRGVVLHD